MRRRRSLFNGTGGFRELDNAVQDSNEESQRLVESTRRFGVELELTWTFDGFVSDFTSILGFFSVFTLT